MFISYFPLISSIIFAVFGISVLFSDSKLKTKIIFFLLCLTTFLWQFSWFILFNSDSIVLGSAIAVFGHISILFLPALLYHLALVLLDERNTLDTFILYSAYAFTIILEGCLLFTPFFIDGVHVYQWGMYPKAGILHPLFVIEVVLLMMRTLYVLWSSLSSFMSAVKQNQIRIVIMGVILYNFAATDFITNYGIGIYPLGWISITLFLGFIWFAISQYSLFNVAPLFKHLTLIFSGSLCLAIIFVTKSTLTDSFGFSDNLFTDIIYIPFVSTVLLVVFYYVEKFVSHVAEDSKNPKRFLKIAHEEISASTDMKSLSTIIMQTLNYAFNTDYAVIWCNGKNVDDMNIERKSGISESRVIGLRDISDLFQSAFLKDEDIIVSENIKYYLLPSGERERLSEELKKRSISAILKIKSDQAEGSDSQLKGYVLLGTKPYQENLNKDEVEFLERIRPTINTTFTRIQNKLTT